MQSNAGSRRQFLKQIGGLAALTLTGLHCGKKIQQPNIVFIIGDDISWNDFGCYGHPAVRTPHIDRMARKGVRFTNTFLTASSCSPSRCSIITGRYPHNTGAAELHTSLPDTQIPFPRLLKQAGYYCAQGGKWHMGPSVRGSFDTIHDTWDGEKDPGAEQMWLPLLKNRPKDKPFFFWFASIDAHRNWDDQIFLEKHTGSDAQIPPYLADAPGTRQDLARYYDEISRLDHYVGEVEKELQRQGVADNTVILFMADNGRPFPRCKTRVYDSGMKTAMIVKWPAGIRKPGSICDRLVSAIDIAPTLLDLCGIQPNQEIQGRPFTRLLNQPKARFRDVVFSEHNWHDHEALERMVRTDDFLYVLNERPQFPNCGPADSNNSKSHRDLMRLHDAGQLSPHQNDVFLNPRPREELFDLKQDKEQLNNVAQHPEYEKALTQMRQLMKQWRQETGDSTPKHLTPDGWIRHQGGKAAGEFKRGEMPGASKHAQQINAPGPF